MRFRGFKLRGRYVGEDRACARHNMAFAPWWAECSSQRFQLTFKIPSGSSARLRGTFENIVLVEVKHPQFKLCRSTRESQMVDHAVSAIRDPRTCMDLSNGSRQCGKRRYSDR